MTSSGQLDDSPASMPSLLFDNTEKVRNSLDPQQPLLSNYIQFTQVMASSLNAYFTFLDEDTEPDIAFIRDYMKEEMTQLLRIRKLLIADLRHYFTNQQIIMILSPVENRENRSEVIDACIDELDSIRTAVKTTLRNAVWATLDGISSEHVPPAQRQESRTMALQSLQSLAQKWDTLSKQLSSAREIIDQQDSA